MMADSVEAAVRSIQEPTFDKIENMVNNIVKDKLNSDQLNECDLTFRDLETIKSCFLKVLKGIYHHRIEFELAEGGIIDVRNQSWRKRNTRKCIKKI